MPPIKRGSRRSKLGGQRPSPARRSAPTRPKSASHVTRPVRAAARPAPRPKSAPRPAPQRPSRVSRPKPIGASKPGRASSRAAARGAVARLPKRMQGSVKRAAGAEIAHRSPRPRPVRTRPSNRPARVRPARSRLQRLASPPRRTRTAIATATTALAAGALTRAAFGPAYRARSAGFKEAIALPAPASAGTHAHDEDVAELIDAVGRLQQAALLPAVGQDLDEINALVGQLPATLAALRSRGYVHQRQLELQVSGLTTRWDQNSEVLAGALYTRQTELVDAANRLLELVDRLYQPNADRGTVSACWSGVRALQSQIEAAYRALRGQYDDLATELELVEAELVRLSWTLDQIEAVPLSLLAGEAPLRAASAHWLRGQDQEGRPGLIILTDQRLLFVRREEVITERFLFITLAREIVQALEFEVSVHSVTGAEAIDERSGPLGLQSASALDVRFDETVPLPAARWLLARDDGAIWVALIGRAQTGDIDAERTEDAAQAAEALDMARRQAPTQCPHCSAPLELPAVRGATAMTCHYCGSTVAF